MAPVPGSHVRQPAQKQQRVVAGDDRVQVGKVAGHERIEVETQPQAQQIDDRRLVDHQRIAEEGVRAHGSSGRGARCGGG